MSTLTAPPMDEEIDETPITFTSGHSRADRTFFGLLASSAGIVLVLLLSLGVFLVYHGWWALSHFGVKFFTGTVWSEPAHPGVLGLLVGSVEIALVASVFALPVSIATALMINEFARPRLRGWLTALIDLLATVPSIVFGFWGLEVLTHYSNGPVMWLANHFGFIPIFRTKEPGLFGDSIFECGIVVFIMITPVITSICREVMSQTPREACEGALALGGTRWGMITDVVLPFSRSGIVGGTLLGLSRALGETIAVLLILSPGNVASAAILGPKGSGSVTQSISALFVTSGAHGESELTLAGLTLFVTTLVFSLGGRLVVQRGRGAT
jgi:phosphate transport system permease protein